MRRVVMPVGALLLILSGIMMAQVVAAPIANPAFQSTWERTDLPVAAGAVGRTWMWGPEGFTGPMQEDYAQSLGGKRTVQYFDKSRMEITDPSGDQSSPWYVTNGLLVVELVTGKMQTGDSQFTPREPAQVNVAGDPDDTEGPTYATFGALLHEPAAAQGDLLQQLLARDGSHVNSPAHGYYNVVAAQYVPETQHAVASPFWSFMNATGTVYENGGYTQASLFQNPFYATGYPITEAYWANIHVGGDIHSVLMQCFERRCLTYTPDNDPAWQVEMGNVGQHYYAWRYEASNPPPVTSPTPPPPPSGSPTETPGNGIPAEGNVIDIPAVTNWQSTTDACGSNGKSNEGEYQLHIQASNNWDCFGVFYALAPGSSATVGDGSYSIAVRRPSAHGDASACLVVRSDSYSDTAKNFPRRSYNFCLNFSEDAADGYTAFYQRAEVSGGSTFEPLLDGTLPPSDPQAYHQLKLINQGDQFWFFVDGTYYGTVSYAGGVGSGRVGVAGFNFESSLNVTLGFDDLVVRSIE